jgi:hypothetical protein
MKMVGLIEEKLNTTPDARLATGKRLTSIGNRILSELSD